MLRVAHFTNNYLPWISGVGISIRRFHEGLREWQVESTVFAPKFREHVDTDPSIVRLRSLPLYYRARVPIPVARVSELVRELNERRIDVVHSHHPFGLGRTALGAARKLRTPIVFTYHTNYQHYTHYLPMPYNPLVARFVQSRADKYASEVGAVVAPSRWIKERLRHMGLSKPIAVIPTGVPHGGCEGVKKKREARLRLGLAPSATVVLVVGRLSEEKSTGDVVPMCQELLRLVPTAECLVAGGGYLRPSLQRQAARTGLENRINLLGSVDPGRMPDLYRASDVLAFLSTTETQGLPLYEARAMGTPVVARRSPAAHDASRHGGVVECGHDVRSVAQAIARTIDGSEESVLRLREPPRSVSESSADLASFYRCQIENQREHER